MNDPKHPDNQDRITPGGFHGNSPFDRQYRAPRPVEQPTKTTRPETVVDMGDLEEAYHRIENIIDAVESANIGESHVGRRVVTASGDTLSDDLETIRVLIYRNLR